MLVDAIFSVKSARKCENCNFSDDSVIFVITYFFLFRQFFLFEKSLIEFYKKNRRVLTNFKKSITILCCLINKIKFFVEKVCKITCFNYSK